jgi:hypothetical protein
VSSQQGHDLLQFAVDGEAKTAISGSEDWIKGAYIIPPGPRWVEWNYTKDSRGAAGSDAGWVDAVSYTPLDHVLEIAAVEFETERLSDLRASLDPISFEISGRPFVLNTSFVRANPGDFAGTMSLAGIPPGGAMQGPYRRGRVVWNSRMDRAESRAVAAMKDPVRTNRSNCFHCLSQRQPANPRPGALLLCGATLSPVRASGKALLCCNGDLINPPSAQGSIR